MELTCGERQIYDVGDGMNKDRSKFFHNPGSIVSESDCLLGQLNRIIEIADSDDGVKQDKLGEGVDGECGMK